MPKCTLRDAVETVLQNHRIVFKNSDNTPTRNESLPGIRRIAWPTVRSLTVGVMREIIRAVQSTDEAKGYAFVYVSFTSPSRGENHGLIVGLTTREDILSRATKVDSGGIWAWANDTPHVYTCSGPDDSDMLCSPDSEVRCHDKWVQRLAPLNETVRVQHAAPTQAKTTAEVLGTKREPIETIPLEPLMADLSKALGKHGVNTGWLVNLLKTNLGNVPQFVGPESLTMIVDAEEAKLIEAHRSEKSHQRTTLAKAQNYFKVMADAAFVEAPDGLFRIMAVMDPTKGGGIKDPEGVCLEPNDSEAAERAKPGQFDMSWEHFIELFEATPSMKILGTQVLTVK